MRGDPLPEHRGARQRPPVPLPHVPEGGRQYLCRACRGAQGRTRLDTRVARAVEDVLARRSRMLFLDARKAIALAPAVADVLREELGADPRLDAFLTLAQQYLHVPA